MRKTMAELEPLIRETVEQGGSFPLITAGTSMLPLLRDRTDTVYLVKAPDTLKKYDIPLYKRADGSFVLHRVVGVTRDGYRLCGDNQIDVEYPVLQSQVVAVVSEIVRDGKNMSLKSLRYRAYCVIRCAVIRPLKRLKMTLRRLIQR